VTDQPRTPLYRIDPAWGLPPGGRVHDPVLVVALDGWVDAGLGSSAAIAELLSSSPTAEVASFDIEALIDQRARRPIARLVDGVTESLTWPSVRILAGKDRIGADILYLTGPEPDFHWRSFTDAVIELVHQLGVRMVVGLGAFPAPTPHTRPVRLASTVPPESTELIGRVGFVQGTIEVPAGVQAALEVALGKAGVPVIGLWARVPHYVAAMPFPEASAALIEGLCALTGLVLDTSSLRTAGEASRRQVDELIAGNAEHTEMVRRLETSLDSEEGQPDPFDIQGGVPSGDEIAAELEQFLRGEGN
jgi:predicted ATP-grasp superfamily ATP-dependent carboligase